MSVYKFLVQNLAQIGIEVNFDITLQILIWLFDRRVSHIRKVWINHHRVVIKMGGVFSVASIKDYFGHFTLFNMAVVFARFGTPHLMVRVLTHNAIERSFNNGKVDLLIFLLSAFGWTQKRR